MVQAEFYPSVCIRSKLHPKQIFSFCSMVLKLNDMLDSFINRNRCAESQVRTQLHQMDSQAAVIFRPHAHRHTIITHYLAGCKLLCTKVVHIAFQLILTCMHLWLYELDVPILLILHTIYMLALKVIS